MDEPFWTNQKFATVGIALAFLGVAVGIGQWLIPPDQVWREIKLALIVLAFTLALAGCALLVQAFLPPATNPKKRLVAAIRVCAVLVLIVFIVVVGSKTESKFPTPEPIQKPTSPVPPSEPAAKPSEPAPLTKLEPKKENTYQTDKARIEQVAKEKRAKLIAKLCFHSPLSFTQTRLENFQTPPTLNFEYAKEIQMKPFSFSGPTTVRIHVDGGVSWFHTTPRDKEFERFNGGVGGGDYVEVPVSSKVLEEKHWSITLYGERPFDVICIDKLPKKPNQAATPIQSKEKLADVLIKKYSVTNPEIGRPPQRFLNEWLPRINRVRNDRLKPDLQAVIREMGRLRTNDPPMKELVAEAIFTLRCLASEGYISITETTIQGRWLAVDFDNLGFEFVPERLNEFVEGLASR